MAPSYCYGIAVIRTDDRQVLARHDNRAPPAAAAGTGASTSTVPPVDWAVAATKVAAASVNRTRLQVDLADGPLAGPGTAAVAGSSGGPQIHAVVSRPKSIAVAAVCNIDTSSRAAFVLCDTALAQFERMFPERAASLSEAQCHAFAETLAESVAKFNAAMAQVADDGRIDKVKRAVEMTKQTVLENIDQALERGAKIDSIVEASADLSENAQAFHRQSVELERTMWFRSVKMRLVIGGVIAVVIVVLVLTICGKKCLPGGADAKK